MFNGSGEVFFSCVAKVVSVFFDLFPRRFHWAHRRVSVEGTSFLLFISGIASAGSVRLSRLERGKNWG